MKHFQYTNPEMDGTEMLCADQKLLFHTRGIFPDTEKSKSLCLPLYPAAKNMLQNPLQ